MTELIGILGGTFDPVHFGHINLAIEMMEARALDQVWFCPAWISPHKLQSKPIEAKHRAEMLNLALCGIPQFSLLDMELQRKGPSYTVDTIETLLELHQRDPAAPRFSLIIGDDAASSFHLWHRANDIVRLVPLLVGQRPPLRHSDKAPGGPQIAKAISDGLTPTKILEISSTQIRNRIRKGLYCGHLLPQKVLDYIYTNDLYFGTYE